MNNRVCCTVYYRHRLVFHTAHIAVYQSVCVRAICSRYAGAVGVRRDPPSTHLFNSVAISLEVENVNTVILDFLCSLTQTAYVHVGFYLLI